MPICGRSPICLQPFIWRGEGKCCGLYAQTKNASAAACRPNLEEQLCCELLSLLPGNGFTTRKRLRIKACHPESGGVTKGEDKTRNAAKSVTVV